MPNKKITQFPINTFPTGDNLLLMAASGNTMTLPLSGLSTFFSANTGLDVFVTGGTYSNGTAVFENNTGGTFSVSGFTTGNTVQAIFGARYSASSWNNLSDFIPSGATVNVVANQLQFSGGSSDYTQALYINDVTCLENWSFSTRFTTQTTGAGIAIGTFTYHFFPNTQVYLVAQFNTSAGTLSIGASVSGATVPANAVTASGTVVFSPTDVLEMTIQEKGAITSASIRNVTTSGAVINCTYTYIINSSSPNRLSMVPTARMSIWNLGGAFTINSLNWFVYEPKNSPLLIVGDSKSKYFASEFGNRYSDLLNNYFPTVINASGSGDATPDVLHRINEIINLTPKRVLLAIGRNDINHITPTESMSNYDSIVSQLTAAGIQVFHTLPFWEPTTDQTYLVNHINSTYPASNIIDCYSATEQANLTVDGVHGLDKWHRIVFQTIISSGKLGEGHFTEQNPIRSQTEYIQSASFNIDGKGTVGDTFTINGKFNSPQLVINVPVTQTPDVPFMRVFSTGGTSMFEATTNNKWNIFIGVGAGAASSAITPTSAFSPGSSNIGIGGNGGAGAALAANTLGVTNVAVGGSALGSNTIGNANTAVGVNALFASISGSNNTAVGQAAMAFNTTGSTSTGIGFNTLRNNTIGIENTAMGSFALWNNAGGSNNVVIGVRALAPTGSQSTKIDSNNNIAIGWQAGWLASIAGGTNILLGHNTMNSSTIGNQNIFIGDNQTASNAIFNTTLLGSTMSSTISNIAALGRADQNILLGQTNISTDNGAKVQVVSSTGIDQTLLSLKLDAANTVGTSIISIKNSADVVAFEVRTPIIAGFTSTFLGKNSGSHCTNNTNVGVGEDALAAVTNATSNVAIGFRALTGLTTGVSNVAIGHASQGGMLTGSRNLSMGRTSILRASVGNGNIVFGDSAMQEASDAGLGNVIIGITAFGAGQGDNNVVIGNGAMFYQNSIAGTTRPSTQNIAIGYRASFTTQLGINNTVLGTQANISGILGDNNILIGASTDSLSSITNTTIIGTGIATSLSNIAILGRADQNVIIGQTTPTINNGAKIQVNGNMSLGVIISSASTLSLSEAASHYVYKGVGTATWTLPIGSGKIGWTYFIKNKGAAIIILIPSGSDTIYSTSSVTTFNINPGEASIVFWDGENWNIE